MMRSIVTVNTPSSTIDLTTLETVKAELGITNTDQDANLSRWITEASRIAATYTQRTFGQETVTETFRPTLGYGYCSEYADKLWLSRVPVASITSVTEDGTLRSASEYEVDANSGALYRLTSGASSYWATATSIVVVYVAGYELLDTLPQDIERAVISMISDMRSDAAKQGDATLQELEIEGVSRRRWWVSGEGQSSSGGMVLPASISGLLDPYIVRWGHMR